MRHRILSRVLIACAVLAAWTGNACASAATGTVDVPRQSVTSAAEADSGVPGEASSALSGRWRLVATDEEETQRLEAIDRATAGMGGFMRGRARSRLAERTSPPGTLFIEIGGPDVTIVAGDRRLQLRLGNDPIEVSGDDGRALMSAAIEDDQLVVLARGDSGERTTTYRVDGDRLSVEVVMTGSRLGHPLTYVATYDRIE
jgi:hypothetical protein